MSEPFKEMPWHERKLDYSVFTDAFPVRKTWTGDLLDRLVPEADFDGMARIIGPDEKGKRRAIKLRSFRAESFTQMENPSTPVTMMQVDAAAQEALGKLTSAIATHYALPVPTAFQMDILDGWDRPRIYATKRSTIVEVTTWIYCGFDPADFPEWEDHADGV